MANSERNEGRPQKELTTQKNPDLNKPGEFYPESDLARLLAHQGVLSAYTPAGKEPTVFSIEGLERLRSELNGKVLKATKLYTQVPQNEGEVHGWKRLRNSIENIEMAYEIIIYPVLDIAQERHLTDPARNPDEPTPAMYKTTIEEKIGDAYENPDKDTKERDFPHRFLISLTEEEVHILGNITRERGLPFHADKREYRYTEHFSRMIAKQEETMRRFGERIRQNMSDKGMLRDRREIEEEIQKRQENWRGDQDDAPLTDPPPQPKK